MKIELDLSDKPEVHYIAGALQIDADAVVGKLFRVWSWFDKHTENGHAFGVTFVTLDKLVGHAGFGEAMQFAGWLEQKDKTLVMPNFDRHNGESAKKRGLAQKRKSRERHAKSVTETRPEKRREEKIYTKAREGPMPEDFAVSDRVKAWAAEKGFNRLEHHLEAFKLACRAKGYKYIDWDSAFMRAVSDNWAKIKTETPTSMVKRAAV